MCVNNLSKVALDSAAAGIAPAISSRKFNALTTTSQSCSCAFSGDGGNFFKEPNKESWGQKSLVV